MKFETCLKNTYLIFIVLSIFISTSCDVEQKEDLGNNQYHIIPYPVQMKGKAGQFSLNEHTKIYLAGKTQNYNLSDQFFPEWFAVQLASG